MRILDRATAFRRQLRRKARTLVRDQSGVTLIEFAFALPILGTMSFYGLEIAYMASVSTQVSQIALSVADNASRLGQTNNSASTPSVAEADIDAVMYGALQQGAAFDFEDKGRIILSSLEVDDATGRQYIHWQRCVGDLDRASSYGDDEAHNGLTGAELEGLGEPGREIAALPGRAVMHVEVYYAYEPLLAGLFVDEEEVEFRQEAAYVVRDRRDLDGGLTGEEKSSC
jgi:hypothetical protein